MGKQSRNRANRAADKDVIAKSEGELRVSFVFDGQVHIRTHQMNAGEIAHMKELCVNFGDEAAEQLIWRQAVRNSGWFAENVLAVAGQAYVLKHHKPKELPPLTVFGRSAQEQLPDAFGHTAVQEKLEPAAGNTAANADYTEMEVRVAADYKIDPNSGLFVRKEVIPNAVVIPDYTQDGDTDALDHI